MKYISLLALLVLWPGATYAEAPPQQSPFIDYVGRSLNNTVVVREKGEGSYTIPNHNGGPRVIQERDLHPYYCDRECQLRTRGQSSPLAPSY